MNLGDIFGSISPAFGMATGQGLGQYAPYLSPAFLAAKGLGGGGGGQPNALGNLGASLAGNAAQGQRVSPIQKLGRDMKSAPLFRSGAGMSAASPSGFPGGGGMESFLQMILDSIGTEPRIKQL